MIIIGSFKKEKQALTDIWPKDQHGQNEKAVFLCHFSSNDLSDEIFANMLEAYGIPCLRQYPGDGDFGKVVLGMSGFGTDIYVPESMFEDALNLFNNREGISDEQLL